jgi:hypothetical protein
VKQRREHGLEPIDDTPDDGFIQNELTRKYHEKG